MRAPRSLLVEHDAEIEDEVITVVSRVVGDTDWEPNDALSVDAYREQTVAELASRDDVFGYALEVEEWCLCRRRWQTRDDGAFGHLMDNLGAWMD